MEADLPPPSRSKSRRDGGHLPEIRSERRIVTALFCDIADSTALAERLDPEDWVEILDEAFQYIAAPIQRYDGTLLRLLGDALLAYFGAPVTHEDDPERAVLAGMAILEDLKPFQEMFRLEYGAEFQVRIGINTGPAIVGALGVSADEYTALGDAVNVAARLQQAAEPGTVLISGDTHRHVDALFDVRPLGELNVKGKREPVAAFQVLRYRPPSRVLRGGTAPDVPLIGRREQLDVLENALQDLARGRGQIIMLVGESGLGKTRLIDELHRRWSADPGNDGSWEETRGISYDTMRPYGLFLQLLRREVEAEPAVVVSGATGNADQRGSLARVRRVVDSLQTPESGGASLPLTGPDFQHEFVDAVESLYMSKSADRPRVLVFDDLHWADAASIDLLIRLMSIVEHAPILIVCAMRPERRTPAWRVKQTVESEYPHRSITIQLAPLSDSDSDELITHLMPERNVPEPIRRVVHEKTEGNPLFVEELARSLAGQLERGGGDHSVAIPVPDSLQALLTARIDHLDPESRSLLQYASVIGRVFSQRVLERVARSATTVESALNTLERFGIIHEIQREADRQYSFRHDLLREAAYGSILRRQRRSIHRQVGETIESLHPGGLEDVAHQLAYHFSESGELDRALKYTMVAAERAARLYANDDAISHYTNAIGLTRTQGNDSGNLAALLAEQGKLRAITGKFDQAQVDWEDSRSLSRLSGDLVGEWRALLGLGNLWTGRDYERAGEYFQLALEVSESIDDRSVKAHSLLQIGNWYVNRERPDEAREFLESALVIFEETDDRAGIAETEDLLGIVADISGDLLSWRAHFKRAVDLYRELDNRQGLASALASLGAIAEISILETFAVPEEIFSENTDEARAESIQIAREIGWRAGEAYALLTSSMRWLAAGQVGDALREATEGASIARVIEHREWSAGLNVSLGMIHRDLLMPDRAIEFFERAVVEGGLSGSLHWRNLTTGMTALAHITDGDLDRARELLSSIERDLPRKTMGQRQVWLARAALASAEGEPGRALQILDEVIADMPNVRSPRDIQYLSRMRGEYLVALGRVNEGIDVLRDATHGAIERGTRSRLWRFYLSLGRALDAAGRRQEAIEQHYNAWMSAQDLATEISDVEMRTNFLAEARSTIFPDSVDGPRSAA